MYALRSQPHRQSTFLVDGKTSSSFFRHPGLTRNLGSFIPVIRTQSGIWACEEQILNQVQDDVAGRSG
jgi:hypothetical protein